MVQELNTLYKLLRDKESHGGGVIHVGHMTKLNGHIQLGTSSIEGESPQSIVKFFDAFRYQLLLLIIVVSRDSLSVAIITRCVFYGVFAFVFLSYSVECVLVVCISVSTDVALWVSRCV